MSTDTPIHARISMTYQDAALLTGHSVNTIRAAVARGDLVPHYPTTKPVLLAEDVEAWVRNSPTERAS